MELPTLNLQELERLAIKAALEQTNGSVSKAARVLGIGRATLYRRLQADTEATFGAVGKVPTGRSDGK